MAAFNGPHTSEWYPVVEHIPSVIRLCLDVLEYVGDTELGGVLITRVPPGGGVKPHVDGGWHASRYRKHIVQLKGNKDQGFFFVDHEVRANPGQIYAFDNSQLHWVKNDSDSDRVSLIICSRNGDE
jgi:aspartyl/asparaginyl beta-hydroxylase (cupin superfamily)